MVLELQLDDVVLVNGVARRRRADRVAEQRQTGEREVVLIRFVEEEAEVGEDDPQLLPAIAVLELAQEVATQLVLQRERVSQNNRTTDRIVYTVSCALDGPRLRGGGRACSRSCCGASTRAWSCWRGAGSASLATRSLDFRPATRPDTPTNLHENATRELNIISMPALCVNTHCST